MIGKPTRLPALSRREHRALGKRIQALLNEIGLPKPWRVTEFCANVAAYRGRPIELLPCDMPGGGPDGMWVELPSVDVILHDQHTSDLHREHIVCHEIGHMLLGHHGDSGADALMPDLDPGVLRAIGATREGGDRSAGPRMHRRKYSSRQEQEAELTASLIWKLGGRELVRSPRRLTADEAEVVDRLADAMERVRRG